MPAEIRRIILQIPTKQIEGGLAETVPTELIATMAMIKIHGSATAWLKISAQIQHIGPEIGKSTTKMILKANSGTVEGHDKESVGDMEGELEHAHSMTHSLWFGNQYRDAVKAKTFLAFSNIRGLAGYSLIIPIMDIEDGGGSLHNQKIHTNVPEAPADEEIIVAVGTSLGGHPLHRIGNRYKDLREMGRHVDNPTGV